MRLDNFDDWFAFATGIPLVVGLLGCIGLACLFLRSVRGER